MLLTTCSIIQQNNSIGVVNSQQHLSQVSITVAHLQQHIALASNTLINTVMNQLTQNKRVA